MKKLILPLILVALSFISCNNATTSDAFDYKIVTIKGDVPSSELVSDRNKVINDEMSYDELIPDKYPNTFTGVQDSINILGNEGWELAGIYTTTETEYPNFGDLRYVTGLQSNVRTREINFVFKRARNL